MIDEITMGDCRQLSSCIADKSIDLIFTDPPYSKRYLYLYDWLAEEGRRVLKDNAFLLVYVGAYWKSEILIKMSKKLDYYFDFISLNGGNSPIMWTRKIISRHKSIMAFRKKTSNCHPNTNVLSLWLGGGEDKRYHTWGQDESTARYYITCFSRAGDLVYDPFCGGGTTPAVCKALDRRFIAFEINTEQVEIAKERILNTQMIMKLQEAQQAVLGII